MFSLSLPARCPSAISRDRSLFALMMSMTASACERSIFPLRNASLVNSPGSAILTSGRSELSIAASIAFSETLLPWPWISSMSSPVYEAGAFMYRKMPSSMTSAFSAELSLTILPRYACLGSISSGHESMSLFMRLALSGPLTLTIPMPPSPGAVEIAAIVSAMILYYLPDFIRLSLPGTKFRRRGTRCRNSQRS